MRPSLFNLVPVFFATMNPSVGIAQSTGPDVIVGAVDNLVEWDRSGDGSLGLSASTDSCNVGDTKISWHRLPDNNHPVIALNLYKEAEGRIIQIAQSWVKHGFFAVNADDCPTFDGKSFICSEPIGGSTLNPGCSDLYGAFLNADPQYLGPRSKINSSSGYFDGDSAQDLSDYPDSSDLERILYLDESVLSDYATREFFLESIYISDDDASAGNSRNNVSYRVFSADNSAGFWRFTNQSPTRHGLPAISEWSGDPSTLQEISLNELDGYSSTIMVGSKVTELSETRFRYDYVVFNMNSDTAIGSLALSFDTSSIDQTSVGFYFPRAHGEIWSEEPWLANISSESISWNTEGFAVNERANAIRWGTAYNFWFESEQPPELKNAILGRFKSGVSPTEAVASVYVPISQ
ncbi:MAG: hypothetical protein AAF483_27830 [Planctomycetota bacterium]